MMFGAFGLLLMILFWVALIAGGVWLVRALFPAGGRPAPRDEDRTSSAREILDQRYARGEITHEQYERMKQDIEA